MTEPALNIAMAIGLLALLAWAVVTDLRARIIPNTVSVLVIGLYALRTAIDWPNATPLADLAVAAAVLTIGFILFARNCIGGGDVKLITALALWAGPQHMMAMAFVISLTGGVIAAGMLLSAMATRPQAAGDGPGDRNDAATAVPLMRRPVPYAVAIAAGGLYLTLQHPAILASAGFGG